MKRLHKLRDRPGERSASWTRGWLAHLDKVEAEDEQLFLELERQEAVVDAARMQLEAAMSLAKEGAMGGPVPHPPPSVEVLRQSAPPSHACDPTAKY